MQLKYDYASRHGFMCMSPPSDSYATHLGKSTSVGDGHDGRRLVFRHDGSGEVVHGWIVFGSDTYPLQGEYTRHTIIVWEGIEWALSFQDLGGTVNLWAALNI